MARWARICAMPHASRLGMLVVATVLSSLATLSSATIGPWMTLAPDGSCRVSLESTVKYDEVALATAVLKPVEGEAAGWGLPRQHRLERPLHPASWLIHWTVPAAAVNGQRLAVTLGARTHEVELPQPPDTDTSVTVLVATPNSYPQAETLAALAEAGQQVGLVILVGPHGCARRLGAGGWERRTPIAVVTGRKPLNEALGVLLGSSVWRGDRLRWGDLGAAVLTTADGVTRSLAGDLSRWRIVIDPEDRWSGHGAPVDDDLLAAIELGHRQHLPLIIAAGGGSGFVTDPLVPVGRHLDFAPGGIRFASLTGSGTDDVDPGPAAAWHLPATSNILLTTSGSRCTAALVHNGAIIDRIAWSPWPLREHPELQVDRSRLADQLGRWHDRGVLAQQHGRHTSMADLAAIADWQGFKGPVAELLAGFDPDAADPAEDLAAALGKTYPYPMDGVEHGSGWGLHHDIRDLVTRWREGDDDEARAAAKELVRLPMPLVRPILDKEVVTERLLQRAADLDARIWIGRLFTLYPRQGLVWLATQADAPAAWTGQAILAYVAGGGVVDDPAFRRGVLRCQHAPALRMLARRAHEATSWILAAHLRDRLQAQLADQVPMDADPLLQHRILSAVFGSPYLSPTPLRPLAVTLRDHAGLSPLGRKPVAAFLERHGEARTRR